MSVGFDTKDGPTTTVFRVKNISNRDVKVFNVPILKGQTYNLLSTDYISEADIRASLLKGSLRRFLINQTIIVIESNIDLIQFDDEQKAFLNSYGIINGTESGGGGIPDAPADGSTYGRNNNAWTVVSGGTAVTSVTGNNITVSPTTGNVVVDGTDLLARDGSREMTGNLNLKSNNIDNVGDINVINVNSDNTFAVNDVRSPEYKDILGGNTATFNGVQLSTTDGASNYLAGDGTYKPVSGGGTITLIEGEGGVNVTNGSGPTVTIDGYDLLPLDGLRAMTGNLDIGGNNVNSAALVSSLGVIGSVEIESPVFRNIGGANTATFNGVQLSATEDGYEYLSGDGAYKQVPAGDVSFIPGAGISATNVQDAIEEANTFDQYDNTFFVDTAGDPTSSGKNPAHPTTLANAIANATFSSLIIIAEGIYADADGPATGTLTVPNSNITLKSAQGGSQSNSVILSDDIIIGNTITRVRFAGLRLDGDINDNNSLGRHYFSSCSAGGSPTFTRTDPRNWVVIHDCDFGAIDLVATGTGTSGSVNINGSGTQFGQVTNSASNFTIELNSIRFIGRITLSDGTLTARDTLIIDSSLAVDATGTSIVYFNTVSCLTSVGIPIPINAPFLSYHNAIFNSDTSTIGTDTSEASHFGGSVQSPVFTSDGGSNNATFNGVNLSTVAGASNFLAGDGTYKAVSASPASPSFSLQFNNSGSFDGNEGLTVEFDSAGARQLFKSPGVAADATGIRWDNSLDVLKSELIYDESIDALILGASTGNVSIGAGNQLFLQATSGPLVITSAGGVTLDSGTAMSWPSSDGDDGYVLTTDGTGGLTFEPASSSGDFLLRDGSLPMTGSLNMDGNSVLNASALFASVGMEAPVFTSIGATDVATFNGVTLTTGGVATNYLDEQGSYTNPITEAGGPFLPLTGGTVNGTINMNLNAIVGGTYNGVGLTTSGSATDFLNAEGNYVAAGGGSGDVVGPGSATDNAVALFDGATGKLIQEAASVTIPFSTATDSQIDLNGTVNATIQAINTDLTLQNLVLSETFSDTFSFPSSDGSDGYVMTTDGNGALSLQKTAFTRNTSPDIQTSSYFAGAFETVRYNPTGGTFTIFAPSLPVDGDRFTVKNRSASTNTVTISGNGNDIEDPLNSFALAATISNFGGDGISTTWEYFSGEWLVV